MNTTDLFIQDLYLFSNRDFPDRLMHQVKRCLIDYIGATLAGSVVTENRFQAFLAEEEGHFLPVGGELTSFLRTAFINGYHSHVMEMDDGHRFAMLHLSAPIISAMMAVAQKEQLSFQQFAKGVIVGFETTARLAMAIQPSHKQKGYHATGTCGVCGVAMAVATALNFSKVEMKNALSAAATSAGSLLESIEGSSQMKPYNIAIAVQNGITAAYFGKSGFRGPDDVLGGKRGFLVVLSDQTQCEKLRIEPQDPYCIEQIYVKPYAACRHCHAPIECALRLCQEHQIDATKISKIEVRTYKLAVFGHDQTEITGENSAKMSMPYAVAVALIKQDAGIAAFQKPWIEDPAVLALCNNVIVVEDAEFTAKSPAIRGANMTITMQDGLTYQLTVDYAKGEPENPITDQELQLKYRELAQFGGKTTQQIDEILNCIQQAETSFEQLHELLSR